MAEAHEQAAAEARDAAARYGLAGITESRVAGVLAPLAAVGYTLLPDRAWPGSRRSGAQVDLIVVGPSGVHIVDTKAWKEVSIRGGRIFRGQADVSDDLANMADLAHNTEALLSEVGLAATEVHALAVLAGHRGIRETVGPVTVIGEHDALRHVTSPGARLTSLQVDTVLRRVLDHFPVLRTSSAIDVTVPEPVLTRPTDPVDTAELITAEEVNAALLDGVLEAPIETWMSFLDPAQAKLARRSFNGPARIRGSAGTGKTVVGLHRAAYLARGGQGKVLFTTFVKTLPVVLENLFVRMAPEAAHQVEFANIHKLALGILRERGTSVRIDPKAADAAFAEAWAGRSEGGALGSSRMSSDYWRDEITYVIKGRGIRTFEQYADLARVGRRHRLTVDQRRSVWSLYERYDAGLRRRKAIDFADVILMALSSVRTTPITGYGAVLVDEAQDLTCAMVAFLHSLVGNRPDGLTLIGDGQQTIYPGGYTLSEVGISLSGRGVVLDVNHRNTAEILAFANAAVLGDEYADIEGTGQTIDGVETVERTGPAPVLSRHETWAEHDAAVVERVRDVMHLIGVRRGDIGVLTATTWDATTMKASLVAAGIPAIDLLDYDGQHTDAVKVGTVKRAKGLEFKQVLLARVKAELLEHDTPAPSSETERERRELDRRELYVAMTRARDGLWVGTRT
ncbi:nuclease-related domain-containing DEAD/DEAH box helicase [Frigoribacterium sp. CFBP 13707]|uniref:nuclease-related domain-containing DEAD/DEAH box helicase n=1 Tax=Frigoribacterium sp. CFBP 13707 TaxID=2775313 RepID=UPI0018D6635E|nr:UvrD-helicase domain-containing protein [Frigoribacterium sp. CFBP 13707]